MWSSNCQHAGGICTTLISVLNFWCYINYLWKFVWHFNKCALAHMCFYYISVYGQLWYIIGLDFLIFNGNGGGAHSVLVFLIDIFHVIFMLFMSIDGKDYINIRIYFGHLYFIYGLCGFNGAITLFIEMYFTVGISCIF